MHRFANFAFLVLLLLSLPVPASAADCSASPVIEMKLSGADGSHDDFTFIERTASSKH